MNHNPTSSRAKFQQLHTEGNLLFLGNAWDTASALALEKAGFPAIGTTSYGIAQAAGKRDGEEISFDPLLSIVHDLVACVKIPVSIECHVFTRLDGYGASSETWRPSIQLRQCAIGSSAIATGATCSAVMAAADHSQLILVRTDA